MEIMKVKKTRAFISILVCALLLVQLTTFVSISQACTPVPPKPEVKLDVEADVGSTHFAGEVAEFYVLVSLSGNPTNASIKASLYYNGTLHANLSGLVQYVTTGLYRIPYTIPNNASAGTYALVVNASYYTVEGTALKCFLLSQTLTGWNAWLTEIRNTTATIKTDVGSIQVSLNDINTKLTSINGNIVTIETDIGTIQADIDSIGLTLTKIEGNITTINTSLGIIQGNITSIQGDIVTIKTNIGLVQIGINNLNATLTSVQNSLVTIQTNIGQIQVNLNQINSQLVTLNGTVVTIQTDIGTIKTGINNIQLKITSIEGNTADISTTLGDLNGTIVSIQGDIATIKTDIGEIKVTLLSMKTSEQGGTSLWWVLAAIVAITAVTFTAIIWRKHKKSKA